MKEPPFVLDHSCRNVVCGAIERVCSRRDWDLLAINVRSNHVHTIVCASAHSPEAVMGQLKAWSTRDLREAGLVENRARLWTKMGSTRWIDSDRSLQAAIDYVVNHQ
ncbi:MAG: transposase [Planctomycetota bacterium]